MEDKTQKDVVNIVMYGTEIWCCTWFSIENQLNQWFNLIFYKVKEDEPVLKAFLLMQQKGIGGLPVVDASGNYAVGNISIRDIQYLLTAPEIYKDYRCSNFIFNLIFLFLKNHLL